MSGYVYDYSSMGLSEVGTTAGIFAGIAAFLAAYSIIITIVSVLMIVALWKIFTKAGKPGWAAIIPVYNAVVLFQICGFNPWLLLIALVPGVGALVLAILSIICCFRLAKAFGKGTGFGFGLWILGVIFYPVLAFSDAKYVGYQKDSNAAFEKPIEPAKPSTPDQSDMQ